MLIQGEGKKEFKQTRYSLKMQNIISHFSRPDYYRRLWFNHINFYIML